MTLLLPSRFEDETVLVDALRGGDEHAFEFLIRRHGPRLLQVARSFLRSEEDARDALQDSLISTLRAIHSFAAASSLATWLHRIVVNHCLMKLRTERRRAEESIEPYLPRFLEDGHQSEVNVTWREDAVHRMERKELSELLRRSIDEIPEPYRATLLMRDVEELSTSECAGILGISDNAVKIRLHRARQALRTLLDPHMR